MGEDRISIITPENIELSYEIAGIGSRFLANLIDTIIQITVMATIVGLLFILGIGMDQMRFFSRNIFSWIGAFVILLVFSIIWGYYIFFEVVSNGQTPGKKAMGIRVIKDGGFPVTLTESMIRNLMRFVDFLPFYYGLAVLVMFLNRNSKRLGDFAAGTIVVKERAFSLPLKIVSGEVRKESGVKLNVRALTRDDYLLIREFLERRNRFDFGVRSEFSKKLSLPLLKKMGLEGLPPSIETYEDFLEALASQYRD